MEVYRKNVRDPKRKATWENNKALGLCSECSQPKENPSITKCTACNDKALKRSITYNRKRGMLPAGQSKDELLIVDYLDKYYPSIDYVRNTRRVITSTLTNAPLELDLFIPDLNIAFEIDGPMHRTPCYGEDRLQAQVINDNIKDEVCKAKGISLFRINTDLITDDYVMGILSEALGKAEIETKERAETREMNSLYNNSLHERPTPDHLDEGDDIVRTIVKTIEHENKESHG